MIYQTSVTVRYAETDQMGIAHHANYAIWYEVARTEFIKQLGISYSEIEKMGIMLPLAELTCRYYFPVHYEEKLKIEVRVIQLSAARIQFEYRVFSEQNNRQINVGTTTHAWTGNDLKPLNLKKHHPELFQLIADTME